ncbi:MAG: hypothetical protein PF444_02385, partial [Bacteroidales bacterium]|nr:hypothetical protein [Bacteroidales bacterium]
FTFSSRLNTKTLKLFNAHLKLKLVLLIKSTFDSLVTALSKRAAVTIILFSCIPEDHYTEVV